MSVRSDPARNHCAPRAGRCADGRRRRVLPVPGRSLENPGFQPGNRASGVGGTRLAPRLALVASSRQGLAWHVGARAIHIARMVCARLSAPIPARAANPPICRAAHCSCLSRCRAAGRKRPDGSATQARATARDAQGNRSCGRGYLHGAHGAAFLGETAGHQGDFYSRGSKFSDGGGSGFAEAHCERKPTQRRGIRFHWRQSRLEGNRRDCGSGSLCRRVDKSAQTRRARPQFERS